MNTEEIKEQYFDWLNGHNLGEPISCLSAWEEAYRRGLKDRNDERQNQEDVIMSDQINISKIMEMNVIQWVV